MTRLLLLSLLIFCGCDNNSNTAKEKNISASNDTSIKPKFKDFLDSLDNDNYEYAKKDGDKNIQDSMTKELYSLEGIVQTCNKVDSTTKFSFISLIDLRTKIQDFGLLRIDSTFNFMKKEFNKRVYLYIEDTSKAELKIVYGIKWWEKGQPYNTVMLYQQNNRK